MASSKEFEDTVRHYLVNCSKVQNELNTRNVSPELEIRFGTNPKQAKPISSVDYQNVVTLLTQNGWKTDDIRGKQMLRIIPNMIVAGHHNKPIQEDGEELPKSEGEKPNESSPPESQKPRQEGGRVKMKSSNIRAEIYGTQLIQSYCEHNDLEKMKSKHVHLDEMKFTKKSKITNEQTNEKFENIKFTDFNFNVAYMQEEEFRITSNYAPIQKIFYEWNSSQKIFRSINRVRFHHPEYPVFVDLSIVKTNRKHINRTTNKRDPVPTETIQEASVFTMPPVYEIELELDNAKTKYFRDENKFQLYMTKIRHCIRLILSGLQGTPYPISYNEQETVLSDYMVRMYGETWKENKNLHPFFVGPNSIPLQLDNVVHNRDQLSSVPCIINDYSVTEKADGERALMYVNKTGKIYLITYGLKVLFTGAMTKQKNCFDSLLDGEFIMYGKENKRLFLYAAFDIYYFGGMQKDAHVRELSFMTNDESVLEDKTRLSLLHKFHQMLELQHVTKNSVCKFHMRVKHFESCGNHQTIFEACSRIWEKRDHFDYEIDGLIFTPMTFGVGADKMNEANEINGKKFTWKHSFKWKPPKYNTIDFLVTTVKDKDGKDLVKHVVHENGNMMNEAIEYKTLMLMCGFDKKRDGFMNPFDDVLFDNIPKDNYGKHDESKYEAVPFVPTTPYHPESYLCYMPLTPAGFQTLRMKTLEGDYFEDDTIVEFQYAKDDDTKQGPWKWIPLRVRFDKTQQLREGKKSMNNYATANDNWKSIHYPVTEKMICGAETVSSVETTDGIYYSLIERSSPYTKSLRHFHNLYVKSKLIEGVANYLRNRLHVDNVLLLDYAVGKGGDLSKWMRSNISFVMGIDNHGDNIHNKEDGACVRYLNARKKDKNMKLRALFLEGNSSLNIRKDQKAFDDNLGKDLVQSVFGIGKNMNHKKYVFKHGIAQEGFHISSCQFALHYFFENTTTLHSFLRNLSQCTRLHGYFIGACFDGQKLFNMLYKRDNGTLIKEGESIMIERDGKKVFQVVKKYSSTMNEFPEDETSVGIPIYVYQESIDKMFREYLVHFEYFKRLMEDYGFVLVEKDEYKLMGFHEPTGLFNRMFNMMKKDLEEDPDLFVKDAHLMSSDEKFISFLNRYFIFKKVRDLSDSSLKNMESIIKENEEQEDKEDAKQDELLEPDTDVPKPEEDAKPEAAKPKKIRKVKKDRVILNEDNYSPIVEDLLFDDPEVQTFYNKMAQKTKKKIAMIPISEQKQFVEKLWQKKKNK